jgi:Coenzyme PQQ synthesis protein D (PqqD)
MNVDHVRFVRNQDVVCRKIDGELVIVPIRSGVGDLNSLYTLNPVGSVLWEFMNESHTLNEMVGRVCEEFEVTANQAKQDIAEFLGSLIEEKLVLQAGTGICQKGL